MSSVISFWEKSTSRASTNAFSIWYGNLSVKRPLETHCTLLTHRETADTTSWWLAGERIGERIVRTKCCPALHTWHSDTQWLLDLVLSDCCGLLLDLLATEHWFYVICPSPICSSSIRPDLTTSLNHSANHGSTRTGTQHKINRGGGLPHHTGPQVQVVQRCSLDSKAHTRRV